MRLTPRSAELRTELSGEGWVLRQCQTRCAALTLGALAEVNIRAVGPVDMAAARLLATKNVDELPVIGPSEIRAGEVLLVVSIDVTDVGGPFGCAHTGILHQVDAGI